MLKMTPRQKQGRFVLRQDLLEQLDPKNSLLQLAARIPRDFFEREFAGLYSRRGRSAKPVRLMVGLLLLKQLQNLSDERVVEEWVCNPYFQAFGGIPVRPHRLDILSRAYRGTARVRKRKKLSLTQRCGRRTSPTKLRVKGIAQCLKIARQEGIVLRRSDKRELDERLRAIRSRSVKNKKSVKAAVRRVHSIAWALFREISRKLSAQGRQGYAEQFSIFEHVLMQCRQAKQKVYSLHEPQILCIAKGKAHKKYEFGAKAAVAMTKNKALIVGVKSFARNFYDGDTLQATLEQIEAAPDQLPEKVFGDRGFRGRTKVGKPEIVIPKPPAKKDFGRRSAIEPVIGHLKSDFRLARNYLQGVIGDVLNLFLAAAFNFRKWMREMAQAYFLLSFALASPATELA
jgi:IS5 family transposase